MNETVALMLTFIAGVLLGVVFFGGLWWMVHWGISSNQPALWFFSSLLLRIALILTGFYFFTDSHWQRLLVCLIGFVAARLIVVRFTRSIQGPTWPTKGARRAD